jgi:hypothetical protein
MPPTTPGGSGLMEDEMNAYATLGMTYAASRGIRRTGPDLRTAMAHETIRQIDDELNRWWAIGEPHPADAEANSRIQQLRLRAGVAWRI